MDALAGVMMILAATQGGGQGCGMDQVFADEGWIIHAPEEFGAILEAALQRVDGETGLTYTSTTHVYNDQLGKLIFRIAFDQALTPADTMIDDLVIYADQETSKVYEVRWFDGAEKHLVHASAGCANRPLPWADNSMW